MQTTPSFCTFLSYGPNDLLDANFVIDKLAREFLFPVCQLLKSVEMGYEKYEIVKASQVYPYF